MKVEIIFPPEISTVVLKREYIQQIVEWGKENLEDQNSWKYKWLVLENCRINSSTELISFEMEVEEDAVALKLAWS